jgi:hypothetical protein
MGVVKKHAELVAMTPSERERYVRWWKEHSGLKPQELRRIATAIWSDRVSLGPMQPGR